MKDVERMLVSAYEDGEVESPWKQQLERRLADDPAWADDALVHRRVKATLAAAPEPDWSQARARVLAAVVAPQVARSGGRLVPLSWISVAAAALLVLAAGGGYWLGRQSSPIAAPDVAELQVQVPKAMGLKLSGEGQLLMASTLQRTSR